MHGWQKAGAPTSLCRRRAEPADFIVLPVASLADCRPPALALHSALDFIWMNRGRRPEECGSLMQRLLAASRQRI